MEQGIIDRFEGELAVIEFGEHMRDIPKSKLPNNSKVGDLLIFDGDTITIDRVGTDRLRVEIEELMKELFEEE
ncbi:Protein of unknown function [Carnobacterium iners]|uniref:Uncharacterized protein n=1 Tax=Carnobacterium iners TaxID=1073423 RepID=A0A1X7MNZ7_9LACT|nr:DUF3006 domain-containing protein [Carnobacterium iners]SEL09192.1 Protein of unknown function [Carnobacterium iners]SMH26560.1 Protein of unknown function [Carnobacterium iners]